MIGTTISFKKVNGILVPEDERTVKSEYQPTQQVTELTRNVTRDYQTGYDILNKSFLEFNGNSPLQEADENQKAFLLHPEIEYTDPDEQWRYTGVRPITRNRILSIAAHLTSNVLIPGVFAQNANDEEDKEMAEIMRAIIEWNIRNSDYDITFIYGVIAGLVNPVAYLGLDYIEAMQKIRRRVKGGKVDIQEAVDDVLSGLQTENIPMDEIYITNPYQYYIQKQRAIGRNQFIEYAELEKIYSNHPNWEYVRPGIRTVFAETGTYYDQYDESLDTLANKFEYMNRGDDMQVCYINGIYFGDIDDVEANPMRHRDQEDRPKYPLVKFGSEPIDEKRFFFCKSIASKMMQDYHLTNRTWRITVDTATYNMKPAVGVMGEDKLESDIYFPGSSFGVNKDTKFMQFPSGSTAEGYNLIRAADQSMNESSQDTFRQGVGEQSGTKTAFEFAKLEQNARIQLGLIGKMIVQAVKDLGNLMIDDILRHQTIGEIDELTDEPTRLKFRTFLLPDQTENGKTFTKEIRLTDEFMGYGMSEEDILHKKQKLFEEEGGTEGNRRIYLINPSLLRRRKYLITIDAESLMPKNEAFESAINLEAYDKAIANPLIANDVDALEAVTRDLLLGSLRPTKGREDKYLPKRKNADVVSAIMQGLGQKPVAQQGRVPISRQAMNSQRAGALSEMMTK